MTRSCIDEVQNSERHKSRTRNGSVFAMHQLIGRKAEAASYSDDASNNRVRSEINGTAYELLFNLMGQKVAITSGGAVVEEDTHLGAAPLAAFFNGSLNFEHQDWLGTERFLTGSDGSPIGNYTSYPFGDGYVDNGVDLDPYHFAGMDHDYESTLDHATFREYASAGGRWLSPDPYAGSYDWSNPQSLNRYSYALNDPLSLSDPTGQDGSVIGVGGLGGCVGAAASEGGDIPADIGCGLGIFKQLLGLFGGPSFHGSLKPRPNAQPWDEGNILYGPNIAGALGLPDQTCEFGACGGGISSFQSGNASLAGPVILPPIWLINVFSRFLTVPGPITKYPLNGNLFPGFQVQDGVCSTGPFAGTMNNNPATLKCCQAHDSCYTKYQCNASSFAPLGLPGPCKLVCNATVAACLMSAGSSHIITY